MGTEPESDRYLAAMPDMRVMIGHASSARIERVVKLEGPPEPTMSMAGNTVFSDDGRRLAAVRYQTARTPHTVTVWDSADGRALLTFRTGLVSSLALDRRGTRLATQSSPSTANTSAPVRLWDVDAGTEIGAITPPMGPATLLEFSPDSSRLAIAAVYPMSLKIIDVSSGRQIVEVTSERQITSLAFSPDGSRIAAGLDDGTVSVWALDDAMKVSSLRPRQPVIERVVGTRPIFSRDNRYLIAALPDASLCVFDAATGIELQRLTGHSTVVRSLAATGSHQVVSTGLDHVLRVWNLPEAERDNVVSVLARAPHFVAASPDRAILAAVGWTGDIRAWRVSSLSTAANLEAGIAPDAVGAVYPPTSGHFHPESDLSLNRDGSRMLVGRGLLAQDGSGHAIMTNEYSVLDSLTGHEIAHYRPLRHGGEEIKDVQS